MSFTRRSTTGSAQNTAIRSGELFKDVTVELSGGNTMGPFTLGPIGTATLGDTYTFDFPAGLKSNYARVNIDSTEWYCNLGADNPACKYYIPTDSGFSDIRVYGCSA